MFNKLKTKLKFKLRNYLGISDLEEIFIKYRSNNNKEVFNNKISIELCDEQLKNHRKLINQFDNKVESIHDTVENVVHIGADVYPYSNNKEHSWAVVCIEGKMNIVKFIDLNRQDGRDVLNFLKQFEAGRHCVDVPNQLMFYDNLWKF